MSLPGTIIFYSSYQDSIDINGIETFMSFSRYDPEAPEQFVGGLELYDHLRNDAGTVFYARGTKITPEHIERLLKLRETTPSLDFNFVLKRDESLIRIFSNSIKKKISEVLDQLLQNKAFKKLMYSISINIETFIDEIFSNDSITLALHQAEYVCENSSQEDTERFFKHPLYVAFAALALVSSQDYSTVIEQKKAKLADVFKMALFHNYGTLVNIDSVQKAKHAEKVELYWKSNISGYSLLDKYLLSNEILKALQLLGRYKGGDREFFKQIDWPSTMAKIVVAAEMIISRATGLFFEEPVPVKAVIDDMCVRTIYNELPQFPVFALTQAMGFGSIFTYYDKLSKLIKECYYDSAVPYPLARLKSPTVFLCKKGVNVCKHIGSSRNPVSVLIPQGDLEAKNYRVCKRLTEKLKNIE